MSWEENVKTRMREYTQEGSMGGGKDRIDRVHSLGKLTARERIVQLFDDQKFQELGMLEKSHIELGDVDKKHYWGDGVICGFGTVGGEIVYAVSQDSTVSGGAGGATHVDKICHTLELAINNRKPIVFLCDSGGARIEEGIISLSAYSRLFRLNEKASGLIPQIAAIMGNCAGGSSYSPTMCDFTFMVENTAQLFITGPKVIEALTGQRITMDELGGCEVHSRYSGQTHFLCSSDMDCLNGIKELLRYLCHKKVEKSKETSQHGYSKGLKEIEDIVPERKKEPYDIRKVIYRIVDCAQFLEIQSDFAKNMVIGFARFDGRTVGVVANQPNVLGGAIDCDAADKAARFIRTCDCYNIPLLTLVDVPGFYPGKEAERTGILRHGCKLLYSYAEATVPKITLILRKAYGGAYCAMNSKGLGADIVFAWPVCEIAVMGAEGAVDVMYAKYLSNVEDKDKEKKILVDSYEQKYLNPYFAAEYGMVDEVILPEETRQKIIFALKALETKCEQKSEKKHGNITL